MGFRAVKLDVLFTLVNIKSFFFSVFYVLSLSFFQVLKRTTTCDFCAREKDRDTTVSFYRRRNFGRLVRLSTEKNTGLRTQKWVKKEEGENIFQKITSKFTARNPKLIPYSLAKI